ncbi:hypothetical protein GTA08_BOTSDO06353 [Botryosphaeria dothidea]|uniref:Uncharacterized protein n=1 Tax=Botryosphaeria dothidea TaxID=55169 RepID=A0A8H4ILW9_9PEZI|nr:hypothetical protein GTA08_BOTSDO10146 [Botryosphaeria dothidea]KAF4305910.1 hypothetical protein GTA08_BOTSDO06353 [Botryosphaeria dothidea]
MNSDDRKRKRAMIRIEIRSYGDVDPRSREVCGSTSWEKLHQTAFDVFERDPAEYCVYLFTKMNPHYHRKTTMSRTLWTRGIYHHLNMSRLGDGLFVIYARFIRKWVE